jgi:hypothetical protein
MAVNPFATLGFSRPLLAQISLLPPQPDAIRKIAETCKSQLLRACHPDRVIGGAQQAKEVSEAFELIKRPGEDRDRYVAEFLERQDVDVRRLLNEERGTIADLRRSLSRLVRGKKALEEETGKQLFHLRELVRNIYRDTLFAHHETFDSSPNKVGLLDPPERYLVRLQGDEPMGMLVLCLCRRVVRFLDFADAPSKGTMTFGHAHSFLRSSTDKAAVKSPRVIGSMPDSDRASAGMITVTEAVEALAGIRFFLTPGSRLVTATSPKKRDQFSDVLIHSPPIREIEILTP